jgi:lipopolysaccharide biosynthesis glycosyltransferase
MPDIIDIALGFDTNYAPHAAGVIASVVRRAPGAKFRVIILHTGVSPQMQADIESVAPGSAFVWCEVQDEDLPPFADRGYFNRTTLFRMGLEKLAPADCKRVLYLDSDLAVLTDVRALWSVDLGPYPIGAVIDAYLDADAFAARWALAPGGRYFNAGVLLIDLEKVRAEKLFSAAIDFIAKHDRDLPYNDQDALNWAFWRNWHVLDVKWNVQRFMAMPETQGALTDDKRLKGPPAIIHFMGSEKPWLPNQWHPWAWTYWQGLSWTPFTPLVERTHGVGKLERMRLWLRWLRRRPISASR